MQISTAHAPRFSVAPDSSQNADNEALRAAAQDLEASFIAEMLKPIGFGKSRESFGGGSGEDQFSSLLIKAQADQIVKGGGFGLAEKIYESLLQRGSDEG